MVFIGVDLHTNSFTICRLEADGSEHFETFQLSQTDLDRFCHSVDGLDRAIEAAGEKLAGFEELTSIKGIGARSAAVLLSGIGNIDDFATSDKLAAYIGIVPRVSQSNDTDNHGRLTKRGNKLMRTTLVQCTLIAIRYSGYLNSFYQKIKERRGFGKAIIATARKLLKIIYDTLRNGWVFEYFTKFKIKQNQLSTGQSS